MACCWMARPWMPRRSSAHARSAIARLAAAGDLASRPETMPMAIGRSAGVTRSPYRPLRGLVPCQVCRRRSLTVQAAAGPIPDLVGRDFTAGVSGTSSLRVRLPDP